MCISPCARVAGKWVVEGGVGTGPRLHHVTMTPRFPPVKRQLGFVSRGYCVELLDTTC